MPKILKPIGSHVLVKRGEASNKTKSGLLLPDMSVEPPREGVVESVGWREKDKEEHWVKPGDTVMMPRFGGTDVTFEDVSYTLIQELDLLGVVRDVNEMVYEALPGDTKWFPRH